MRYFIVATSRPAPLISDVSSEYVEGTSPQNALEAFAAIYSHPAGLFSARCFHNSDGFHLGEKALAEFSEKRSASVSSDSNKTKAA